MPERAIIHMDLDTFFVSVECLRDSRLKGKPLIIGGTGNRGVVASCSYEARLFGIHSAMPARLARQLCPDALFISGDMEAYTRFSATITGIIREESPLFEKASIDEFYIDVSGMERFFGAFKWARELRRKIINETGLPISMGLSVNKLVSKVAVGEYKPNGEKQIPAGKEQDFLAPLSVKKNTYGRRKNNAVSVRNGDPYGAHAPRNATENAPKCFWEKRHRAVEQSQCHR